MVNLNAISINPIEVFRNIGKEKYNLSGNKRRDRILALESTITTRFNLYLTHYLSNTLEQVPIVQYSQQVKDDLLHCYLSETKSLSQLIKDIKDNQPIHLRGICQFCGINTDSTTDHFLPKGSYPDYCVNSLNLFPCCPDCNSLKGEYLWDNMNQSRGIINFYTDRVNSTQFLFASVNYFEGVPVINFYLKKINGITPSFFTIVKLHFDRLNLLERYKERFNSVHHQIMRSFQNKPMFSSRPSRVYDFLMDDANQYFQDYGKNSYLGLIRVALANNTTFISQF